MTTPHPPDRNLALELVRVTEAAALAASRWMGRGDKNGADGAAVDAMRLTLGSVGMTGVIVITKLPFAVPSDPVFAARSELFDDPFNQYAVPQAVLKFKQGFGRLIRSGRDRGVCAVLDRRVLSKRYGASFVQSLPECSVTVGSTADLPDAAADWLDEGMRHEA